MAGLAKWMDYAYLLLVYWDYLSVMSGSLLVCVHVVPRKTRNVTKAHQIRV